LKTVKDAGCLLEPSICFSTGPEHTNEFYVQKVREIIDVTGEDIILCIKKPRRSGNPPRRIGDLTKSILARYPDLIIHYQWS